MARSNPETKTPHLIPPLCSFCDDYRRRRGHGGHREHEGRREGHENHEGGGHRHHGQNDS